jgi:hypothetical protein
MCGPSSVPALVASAAAHKCRSASAARLKRRIRVSETATVSSTHEPSLPVFVETETLRVVRRRAAAPGVTTVVGPAGSGKTALVKALARDRGFGRSVVVSGREVPHMAAAADRAATGLGGAARPGDIVIVDGIDEMAQRPGPQDLHWLAGQPRLSDAHLVLTTRPAAAVVLQSRSVLTVGGEPPTAVTDLPGTVVELRWTAGDLRRVLDAGVDDPAVAGAVERLLADGVFLDAPDGGASRLAALQRVLLSSAQAPDAPSLMLAVDAQGRVRAVPATLLPGSGVSLGGGGSTRAAPWVLYRRSRDLWLPGAAALEELINDPAVDEQALQDFFEQHPHLLTRNDHDRVLPHPVLARDEGGDLIPDFMLEPEDRFADVLDLKLPTQPVVAGKANRLRQSAAVSEALAQVREYRAYFDDARRREEFHRRYGMKVYRPSVVVVIGRDPTADPFELRRLWDDLPGHVDVQTYDSLLRRIRRLGGI